MSRPIKGVLKAVTPPPLWRGLRRLAGSRVFRGRYATWAEARAASGGYDQRTIVERVLAATLAVRAGDAAFERDGVRFAEPAVEPGLWRALGQIAAAQAGNLRVIDFGGSLGSTYWRHRDRLDALPRVVWDVVEQEGFVRAGRRYLSDSPVRFFSSVAEAEQAGAHDVLLVSTSLQYLEAPAAAVEERMQPGQEPARRPRRQPAIRHHQVRRAGLLAKLVPHDGALAGRHLRHRRDLPLVLEHGRRLPHENSPGRVKACRSARHLHAPSDPPVVHHVGRHQPRPQPVGRRDRIPNVLDSMPVHAPKRQHGALAIIFHRALGLHRPLGPRHAFTRHTSPPRGHS